MKQVNNKNRQPALKPGQRSQVGVVGVPLLRVLALGLSLLLFSRSAAQADSLQIVTLADFYDQIRLHHPVARQANLLPEQARQELRMARGDFDPSAI